MKTPLFKSLAIAFSFLAVSTIMCYGILQTMHLLEGFMPTIARCEAWLASGMGH